MNCENRPPTPSSEDCCGNGCNPCILDAHKELLEKWKKKVNHPEKNILCPSSYTTFFLRHVTKVSEDFLTLQFAFEEEMEQNAGVKIRPSQYIFLRIGKVSRPYTPIFWNTREFKILVKICNDGEMSQLFKKIEKNAKIDVRGPYGDFEYIRNSFKKIIMLSIGSAIAAIFPVAKCIVEDDLEDSRMHMVSSFRCFSQIPLKGDLRLLCDYWNFSCTVFLSQEKEENILSGVKLVNSRLKEEDVLDILKPHPPNSTLILVAGTEDFTKKTECCLKENDYLNYHVF